MGKVELPLLSGLKANSLFPKGRESLRVTQDTHELLYENDGVVNEIFMPNVIGGYEVTIPAFAWIQEGDFYVASVNDSNVFAETARQLCQVNIFWKRESKENIPAWIDTDTNPSGGSYRLYTSEAPEEGITGVVTITRVGTSW